LTQLSSPQGKILFRESLLAHDAEAYFPLSEQFINQSEPAYCAVASLIMVLNAFGIDPNLRWKGGWRWYGSEEMILGQCCINAERVRQVGILLEEFASLGRCQGLSICIKRPVPLDSNNKVSDEGFYDLDEFRRDLIHMVRNPPAYETIGTVMQTETQVGGFLVVSFSRKSIGQTGDGHYSPIAAYHEPTDQCLVMDVARFKYAPFWVPVKDLYEATKPIDSVTNKSRGWFLIYPNRDGSPSNYPGSKTIDERKKPAHTIPSAEEKRNADTCPVHRK
jgi:glutathione gamma-glutamylcysteinyltransferase